MPTGSALMAMQSAATVSLGSWEAQVATPFEMATSDNSEGGFPLSMESLTTKGQQNKLVRDSYF